MKHLLTHELYRLKTNKLMYTVLASVIVVGAFWAEIVIAFAHEDFTPSGSNSLRLVAHMSRAIFVIMAIAISSLAVKDYQKGVIRNIVISGHSRIKIYLSKYIVALLVTFIIFTLTVIICLMATMRTHGWGNGNVGIFILMYLQMFLQYAAVTAIMLFIADLIRNSTGAIGANIALMLILIFISSIVFVKTGADGETINTTNGFIDFIGNMYAGTLAGRVAIRGLSIWKILQYLGTAIATIAVTLLGGVYLFNKRDLK